VGINDFHERKKEKKLPLSSAEISVQVQKSHRNGAGTQETGAAISPAEDCRAKGNQRLPMNEKRNIGEKYSLSGLGRSAIHFTSCPRYH